MNSLSLSYRKVRYDLRPAKQVERLMLVDALRRLASDGFSIEKYQYTGMGSVHFYDFSLLHRYTGITHMLSVEASNAITKRVKFNCPFRTIKIRMAKIGTVIPELSDRRQHLLWLDYDSSICSAYLADLTQAMSHCGPGSIVALTVDVEPPKGLNKTKDVREHFESELGELLPAGLKLADFTKKNLGKLNAQLVRRAIRRGIDGRKGIDFQLLFHFRYADGHRMLTIGGMIVDKECRAKLRRASVFNATYVRRNFSRAPYEIRVPVLTRKERLHLDANMPCKETWKPIQFEMDQREILAYGDIYRFAPQYAELIF